MGSSCECMVGVQLLLQVVNTEQMVMMQTVVLQLIDH